MDQNFKPELNKLYQGIDYETYAAQGGIRSSWLYDLKRSPAHLQAALKKPQKDTPALQRGRLFHSAIENGEKFLDLMKVEPEVDRRTKAGKEAIERFHSDLKPDAIVVPFDMAGQLIDMIKEFSKHRLLRTMLKNSVKESSLWVQDPETGETLQCRPDFITEHGHVCDIKTTRDAREPYFLRQVFSDKYDSYHYVLQAAHYAHCVKVAGYGSGDSFTFVAVETEPPYGIKVYPLDVGCLGPGEQWRYELTKLYARCKTKNEWPNYSEEAVTVCLPEWASIPNSEE